MREYIQLELAGSYWLVLLAGLVAIQSLPTARVPVDQRQELVTIICPGFKSQLGPDFFRDLFTLPESLSSRNVCNAD